jgi:hypothetical protein
VLDSRINRSGRPFALRNLDAVVSPIKFIYSIDKCYDAFDFLIVWRAYARLTPRSVWTPRGVDGCPIAEDTST